MFNLAAQHTRWATVRQAVITGNIANANTAGYTAQEVEPFAAVLDNAASLAMAVTAPGHIGGGGNAADAADGANTWEITNSGAPVALDQELVKANDVSRSFALDTSIVRAFHRMLMASTKVGS